MSAAVDTIYLLRNVTQAIVSPAGQTTEDNHRTFQAVGKTTAGAGAVEVDILASNTDDVNEAVLLGTINLVLGTVPKGEGFTSTAPWRLLWARVNSISGTGAAVSVIAGA